MTPETLVTCEFDLAEVDEFNRMIRALRNQGAVKVPLDPYLEKCKLS